MDHPSMEVEADGNHHGYDVGMECHRIKQRINVESTTSCTRVLQDAELGFYFLSSPFFVKNKSCHSLQGEF